MNAAARIRVLIVDDHPVVREGLKAFLGRQPDMIVVGEAASGNEALTRFRSLAPDVTLLDLILPDVDGRTLLTTLLRERPAARILIISSWKRAGDVGSCLEAGAAGFVVKDVVDIELCVAVRAIAAGGKYLSREASQAIRAARDMEPLTAREREILALLGDGSTNEQIAKSLGLGIGTVKNHVHTILAKLGARDRAGAIVVAARLGLIQHHR